MANHIGKTLYVAQALPATNDKAGFEALTFVQVKGIQELPVFGVTHASIDVEDLGTGFTSSVKGAATGQDSQFVWRYIASDPGQIDVVEQALDQDGYAALKIVTGSGADTGDGPAPVAGDPVEYAQGYIHSYEPNKGTTSNFEGGTATFRQNDFTVTDVEPT